MREAITNYIRAGYPGVDLVSAGETKFEVELKAAVEMTNHSLVVWSATTRLVDTGAGIEQGVVDALYRAFAESRAPKTGEMLAAVSDTVPLSKLMGEQIQGLGEVGRGPVPHGGNSPFTA